jgi:hypothetical protein
MENTTEINAVLAKKMESWRYTDDNLIAPQELTVTITLNEYRELIAYKAKADHVKESLERELRDRKEEVAKLTNENQYLRAVMGGEHHARSES